MAKMKKPVDLATFNDFVQGSAAFTPATSIDSFLISHNKSTFPVSSKSDNHDHSIPSLNICRNKSAEHFLRSLKFRTLILVHSGTGATFPPSTVPGFNYLQRCWNLSRLATMPQYTLFPLIPHCVLAKVRRLVDDATDLAVRASNGTTSSLSNSLTVGKGFYGCAGAAVLGLGSAGAGSNAKLSRERRHRMRELATQKLSYAYHLDEIATSVATMQSASSLEDVAKLVLQRSTNNPDAKYVHFFHEKIPSRLLAQRTDLRPLDEIIQDRPTEGALLRTRAVTRIFKKDFEGAIRDLTNGLAICRYMLAQHKSGNGQPKSSGPTGELKKNKGRSRSASYGFKIEEEGRPSSLKSQLLFHRAGVYLTLACQNVSLSLDRVDAAPAGLQNSAECQIKLGRPRISRALDPQGRDLEPGKSVKANAKRALRDYMKFLSNFQYTPALAAECAGKFHHKCDGSPTGGPRVKKLPTRLLVLLGSQSRGHADLTDSLVAHELGDGYQETRPGTPSEGSSYAMLSLSKVYPVSALFSASPPSDLPQFAPSQALIPRKPSTQPQQSDQLERREAVTFHPLLIDALHSLLLCHCLIQTSSKETTSPRIHGCSSCSSV